MCSWISLCGHVPFAHQFYPGPFFTKFNYSSLVCINSVYFVFPRSVSENISTLDHYDWSRYCISSADQVLSNESSIIKKFLDAQNFLFF